MKKRLPDQTVIAVVTTYNRKDLLLECLNALLGQTHPLTAIIVIDNASSDDTRASLLSAGFLDNKIVKYVRLHENTGGAGGFYAGVKLASEIYSGWFWLMDDDAKPHCQALEELVGCKCHKANIYGSTALDGERLSWPNGIIHSANCGKPVYKRVVFYKDLPALAEVAFLPFLGFFIHSDLVSKIGLPDGNYFLAADDVEYCFRARRLGAKFYMVSNSIIYHPPALDYAINLLWIKIWCLKLAPWKRYYDTRNRLLLSKKHEGVKFYFKTIPGSFIRLIGALIVEPDRLLQLKAFVAGLIDGLRGKGGRRHDLWGLSKES
jgi:rhamnopyranosyl-N-acetylglucosaminyl-diphospho-decaprenol beta-1,3/1,4-galactofuranosyltransferase